MANQLNATLEQSDVLQAAIDALHELPSLGEPWKSRLAGASCEVAREHAISLRLLMTVGAGTSAISLLRLQFESVTRAMWITWAASESELERLNAELSTAAEQAAGNMPGQNGMLNELKGKAPDAAYDMLASFYKTQNKTLNSFVHTGIHPLTHIQNGYSEQLVIDVVRLSNALSIMGAMLVAMWSGDRAAIDVAKGLQLRFRDCLPDLVTN
jgi:hypothetical protein